MIILYILSNILSHVIACAPIIVLYKKHTILEFVMLIAVDVISLIHGLIPVTNETVVRLLDNLIICLLISFIASNIVGHDKPIIKLLFPTCTITFFISFNIFIQNYYLISYLIQLSIASAAGIIYYFKPVNIKNWSVKSYFFISLWFVSNMFYLFFAKFMYIDVIHRIATGVCFYVIIDELI